MLKAEVMEGEWNGVELLMDLSNESKEHLNRIHLGAEYAVYRTCQTEEPSTSQKEDGSVEGQVPDSREQDYLRTRAEPREWLGSELGQGPHV